MLSLAYMFKRAGAVVRILLFFGVYNPFFQTLNPAFVDIQHLVGYCQIVTFPISLVAP